MRNLRSFLAGICAFVSVWILWALLRYPKFLLHPIHPRGGHWILAIIAEVFLPGIAIVFGISALSYWRRWRSARLWSLATATIQVLVPFFVASVLSQYAARGAGSFLDNLKMSSLILVMGMLGFVAFWTWDPSSENPQDLRPTRVAGDGTNPFLDKMFWVVAIVGYLVGMQLWERWAWHKDLPWRGVIPWYIGIFIAELSVVLIHEAGHALSGLALGMRLRAFIVGPFQWRLLDGRWQFNFRLSQFFATGGATMVVPTHPHQPVSHEIFTTRMIPLAGPMASLVGGLAAFWMVVYAPGHAWLSWWYVLAMFTTISLLAFVGNLGSVSDEHTRLFRWSADLPNSFWRSVGRLSQGYENCRSQARDAAAPSGLRHRSHRARCTGNRQRPPRLLSAPAIGARLLPRHASARLRFA